MSLRSRLAALIADRLEGHGSLLFVSGKKLIIEYGCSHAEEAISLTHDAWNALVRAIDIPWVSEETERKAEDDVWARIEAGMRSFIDRACPAKGPSDAADVALSADSELVAMSEDPTLPASAA